MGTLAYMPPEQAGGEGDKLDERSDVFSLGATLCEILTGEPPYRGATREKLWQLAKTADLGDTFARLDTCGGDAELIALAKRCLASEISLRPDNAGVVAEAVVAYQAEVQEQLRKAELERAAAEVKAREGRKRLRITIALAASLLALVVLAASADEGRLPSVQSSSGPYFRWRLLLRIRRLFRPILRRPLLFRICLFDLA